MTKKNGSQNESQVQFVSVVGDDLHRGKENFFFKKNMSDER